MYNKSNNYRKHTKIRATELYLWVLGSTSTCFGISIHCCQNSKQNPKGPHVCLFNVAYVLSSVPFTFIWRFAVRNIHNRLLGKHEFLIYYHTDVLNILGIFCFNFKKFSFCLIWQSKLPGCQCFLCIKRPTWYMCTFMFYSITEVSLQVVPHDVSYTVRYTFYQHSLSAFLHW